MVHVSAVTFSETNPDVSKVLRNTTLELDPTKLRDNEILIEALGVPVNPSDSLLIRGLYKTIKFNRLGQDPNEELVAAVGGNEGAFRIKALGRNVSNYKVGEWVILKLTGFGTWRTHAIVEVTEDNPDPLIVLTGLGLDDASTISTNPSTAYQLFHDYISDWSEGDWIITNAGNSFVSKYLLQLAKHHKIKTLSVLRSKPNWDEVVEELVELGATKVIKEEDFLEADFPTKVLPTIVGLSPVRIAYDSLGGPTTPNLAASLSSRGFFVNYGMLSGQYVSFLPAVQLVKNTTFKSYWLTRNTTENPQSKVDTIKKVLELYHKGVFRPVKYNKVEYHDGANLRDVFVKAVQDSKNGKQVVIFADHV